MSSDRTAEPAVIYREQAPPPALAPWVRCVWELTVQGEGGPGWVVPDGVLDLVASGPELHVAGPDTRPWPVRRQPGAVAVGVRFHPGAAPARLGPPWAADRHQAPFRRIGDLTREQELVALDPAATGDVHRPLDFAPTPDAMARRLFPDEVIEAHLDALAASQQPDGGWTVGWPAWTEAAGLEWRAWVTVHNLTILRAYSRLPA